MGLDYGCDEVQSWCRIKLFKGLQPLTFRIVMLECIFMGGIPHKIVAVYFNIHLGKKCFVCNFVKKKMFKVLSSCNK